MACVEKVLRALDVRLAGERCVLRSDKKASYATIAKAVFGTVALSAWLLYWSGYAREQRAGPPAES